MFKCADVKHSIEDALPVSFDHFCKHLYFKLYLSCESYPCNETLPKYSYPFMFIVLTLRVNTPDPAARGPGFNFRLWQGFLCFVL